MEQIIAQANEFYSATLSWVVTNLLTIDSAIQLGIITTLFLFSFALSARLSPFFHKVFEQKTFYQKTEKFWKALYLPLIWWLTVFTAWQVVASLDNPIILLRMATSLISVWMLQMVQQYGLR